MLQVEGSRMIGMAVSTGEKDRHMHTNKQSAELQ